MRVKKLRKYEGKLPRNARIQPLIFDAFGGWDQDADTILKKIAYIWARDEDRDQKLVFRKFTQRLSVLIQLGNARLLRDSLVFPDTDFHEEGGVM